jgi:dephospho-CoA kinase
MADAADFAAGLPAPRTRPDLLIGLTGPIGCGKSAVARMIAELGAAVIDADTVARQVTEFGSPALAEIRQRFGGDVFARDGSLDRAALARIVFADPAALADLERITHPRVREQINAWLVAAAEEGTPVAVIEAIKLVESGLAEHCDEVWLVECSPDAQVERLQARGASDEDIRVRVGAQGERLVDRLSALLEARGVAHRRLSTDGTLGETRERVEDALADALSR